VGNATAGHHGWLIRDEGEEVEVRRKDALTRPRDE
jgi:hypothetical protein